MTLSRLIKRKNQLQLELSKIEKHIDSYPKIGDLIKHRQEENEFQPLTKDVWDRIEFYQDWAYYIIKKHT